MLCDVTSCSDVYPGYSRCVNMQIFSRDNNPNCKAVDVENEGLDFFFQLLVL